MWRPQIALEESFRQKVKLLAGGGTFDGIVQVKA
jgi:hypothetical protein